MIYAWNLQIDYANWYRNGWGFPPHMSTAFATNIMYVDTFSLESFWKIRVYAELHLRPRASNPQLQQIYKTLSQQNLWTCQEDLHEKWTKKILGNYCSKYLSNPTDFPRSLLNNFELAKEDPIKGVRRTFLINLVTNLYFFWKEWQFDVFALLVIIFLC